MGKKCFDDVEDEDIRECEAIIVSTVVELITFLSKFIRI